MDIDLRLIEDTTVIPYRRAKVADITLQLPRALLSDLETNLAAKAGTRAGNHDIYCVTQTDRTAYLWFTDNTVLIGRELVEEPW